MTNSSNNQELPEFIGVCWMEEDGTIRMRLRADGPGGLVGHAMFEYPPDHADYNEMLEHIGPIKPGERKGVRPWI